MGLTNFILPCSVTKPSARGMQSAHLAFMHKRSHLESIFLKVYKKGESKFYSYLISNESAKMILISENYMTAVTKHCE